MTKHPPTPKLGRGSRMTNDEGNFTVAIRLIPSGRRAAAFLRASEILVSSLASAWRQRREDTSSGALQTILQEKFRDCR